MSFGKAIQFVLEHEGGYVFDPHDPGGETKYGISKRAYPDVDIKNLTEEEAIEIYKRDYWEKIQGDSLPYALSLALLDTAVNCGVFKAGIWFQMSLNVLFKKGLKLDGIIGPKTVAAAQDCDELKVAIYLLSLRLRHYLNSDPRYLKGWLSRVLDLVKELLK